MGAGRKRQTPLLKEKSQCQQTSNCSVSAKNLRKSDLGAVIFGCKNHTITECIAKQLFGLPFSHFSYVKNVTPGLTLFLFNYNDRKLHGIYEAASPGQLNINPYGWTVNSENTKNTTPFPAQVQTRIRKQCRALQEEEFRPIIADNYYEQSLFWFELDRSQTRKLIDLFLSSPCSNPAPSLPKTVRWNTLLNGMPSSDSNEARAEAKDAVSEDTFDKQQHKMDIRQIRCASPRKEMNQPRSSSYASALGELNDSLPQRSWSSLFKESVVSDTVNKEELKTTSNNQTSASLSVVDKSNLDRESMSIASFPESHDCHFEAFADTWDAEECEKHAKHGEHIEAPQDLWNAGGYEKPHKQGSFKGFADTWDAEEYGEPVDLKATCINSTVPENTTSSLPFNVFLECFQSMDTREKGGHLKSVASNMPLQQPYELKSELEGSHVTNVSDGGNQSSEFCMHNDEKGHSDADSHEGGFSQPIHAVGTNLNETESSVALAIGEFRSSDIQSLVSKLIQEIGEIKGLQLKQNQKINSLHQELVESRLEVQQMRNHYNMFAHGKTSSSSGHFEGIDFASFNNFPEFDDSILIVGGYDGSSWLSALSLYSPSTDLIKSLTPMTSVRSYTSATKFNGELYLFGGVYGDVWFDTVESYNPRSNRWYIQPPLSKKKGSLAGISVFEKLYAIGGGNGVECLAEVEMLDMNIGKWIYRQPMKQKRFAPGAADINGSIYVVGGYDGRDYLKSIERFDPREHKWTGMASMNTRRGCHSLVALNEKLYALGGYDGEHMVSTVEVFDPRACSWMMGESMKTARGYSGAAVIGEKIYVIGGLKDREDISDTVECYKEGCGWQLTNSKAVGKRCFFSALVL